MSVTIDELITKFSADISDYRKKTEEIKKQLRSVAGVTDIVKEETQKAMKSSTAEIRQYGNQLDNLLKTQTKQSQSLAQSAAKVADYKQKVKLLIETLHEQENEVKKAADKIRELTAQYKDQQDFLSDYDDGIEGIRKQRQELIDYIHEMEAAGKSAYSTDEVKMYQDAVKRAVSDLRIFDKELEDVGLNPLNLKTDTLSKLKSEIQNVTKEQSKWQSAQRTTQASIDSTNRSIVSETMKMVDLKAEIEKNSHSINNLRSKMNGIGKAKTAIEKLKKSFSSVRTGVRKVGSVASSAFSKVTSWLKRIISGSSGTNKSLLNVTKSIKRIGIVSLGLKICKSIFGELRSIVSDYLSKNEALNNKVEVLKCQFANALAPAINVVIGLFEKLMPYVISVANAISDLFSSLGIAKSINATASAVNSTADATKDLSEAQKDLYGFDQITKVSDTSSSSKSENSSAGTISPNEQFSKYLESIKDLWKNGDFEGVGKQIADSLNKVISKINNLDWDGIQKKVSTTMSNIGGSINGFVKNYDWAGAGKVVSNGINTIITALDSLFVSVDFKALGTGFAENLNGLFDNIDFSKAGKTLSDGIAGVFDILSGFFETFDFGNLARDLEDFIKGIDWGKIARSVFESLGAALGGLASFVGQLISDAFGNISNYFDDQIDQAGGNVIEGIFNGIVNWLSDVGTWIKTNVLDSFIKGFKSAFDIHSPSKEPSIVSLGENIISGVFNGIVNWLSNVGTWLKTNVLDKITGAWNKLDSNIIEVTAKFKEDVKNTAKSLKSKINSIKGKSEKIKAKFVEDAKKTKKSLKTKIDGIKSKTAEIKAKFMEDAKKTKKSLKSKIDGIKGKTVEITAKFKDVITGALNTLIGRLNTVIGKLRSINIAGIRPFDGIKDIPKLAQGGIVDRSTLVNVGENGKEAIMPLEKNKGWIYELARQIVEINSGASDGNSIKIILPIYIGGKHLTTVVLNDIKTMTKASKEIPIII